MVEVNSNEVSGFKEKKVRYTIYSTNKDTRSLAIMFPGIGYTVHGPLFHFATGLYLDKGIDVLQLEYPYGDTFYENFTNDQITEAVIYDSRAMIDQALADREYENFYLIGKSLGTISMSNELKRPRFKNAKAVWLTPLLKRDDVWSVMKESIGEGLCFIGDLDGHYIEDRFNHLNDLPNMKTKLYPKVHHGMDYEGDILKSIDVLKDIIGEIEQF